MATDIYQTKYERLLVDPNQFDGEANPSAKLAELQTLITNAGDSATTHAYPTGVVLASALTGNVDSSVLVADGRYFTEDVFLRIVTTVGSTPTATFNIKSSKDGVTYANCSYALIATPQTLVSTSFVITTPVTKICRIPPQQARYLKVSVTVNTAVTFSIDAVDFGGVAI
jgi:hypothetical protein